MSGCPHSHRAGLPLPIPDRLSRLPTDERGYPIPFFVATIDGKIDFRIADRAKWERCVTGNLCWVCGETLGAYKAFVVGPMCVINRTSADPPSHKDCAEWSVLACPFLTKPGMVRREDEVTEKLKAQPQAGVMIERNPGVAAIWVTKDFEVFDDGKGGKLLEFKQPESVTFWKEGRLAKEDEIFESVMSGLPQLMAQVDCFDALADIGNRIMYSSLLFMSANRKDIR